MFANPLSKAESRLRSARRALEAFKRATDPDTLYDHWVDYLTAWKGVVTCLEQAAKSSQKEMVWFAQVKRVRKGDPLLQYLFEARNDETHGADFSAERYSGKAVFKASEEDVKFNALSIDLLNQTVSMVLDGEKVGKSARLSGPGLYLHPVKARGNRIIPVPLTHQEESIEASPVVFMEAGLNYAEELFETALSMSKS